MAFDGLTLKAISFELKDLIGYKIDRIYEPTKNDIVLSLYGEKNKFALEICIDSKFYRIHLTTHPKPNPKISLNFSMLLRKHITGYKIKDIITFGLERIIILKLESFDPYINDLKYLIIELMGKHSNIILADKDKIIIDSIRHTYTNESSYRNIYPKQLYVLPKPNKLDFLLMKTFDDFYNIIKDDLNTDSLDKIISNKFTGISSLQIKYFIKELDINNNSKENLELLFNHITKILKEAENKNIFFEKYENDYAIKIQNGSYTPFICNYYLDDYYNSIESDTNFKIYRDSILKMILNILKKYNKRLLNINDKLNDCSNMEKYKLYGELITSNLYKYNNDHLDSIDVFNYYSNKNIVIPLDKKLTVHDNMNKYYKKYNKLKNALTIVNKQKIETLKELNYIESIVYELENSTTIEDVNAIYEEISENIIFKTNKKYLKIKQKKSKRKKDSLSFNPLIFNIENYKVLVGRNNRENDWLTFKNSNSSDIWFHTKDIHGSHVILKSNGNINIEEAVLVECAKLAAKYSKAKNSSNVPVDYTQVKNVKKPNGAKPGMVIYTHNTTLFVNP